MFKIEIIKPVIFKDQNGDILKQYHVGDQVVVSVSDSIRNLYITTMGGIWFDEAKVVTNE